MSQERSTESNGLRSFIEGDGSYVRSGPTVGPHHRSAVKLIADQLSAMDGLDRADRYTEVLRVAKIFEEAGETMQALIAYHDANPRKEAGTLVEVLKELSDVALSAKVAVESFGGDADALLAERERAVLARLQAKARA